MLRTLLALFLAVLVTASAGHPPACEPSTKPVILGTDHQVITIPGSAAGQDDYYVYNESCQLDGQRACLFSVWVFRESNGIPGLQQERDVFEPPCDTPPDEIVL